MATNVYSSVKTDNSFGRVHSVLRNSNIQDYMQVVSSAELLKKKLAGSNIDSSIKSKEEFYSLLSYMFQSMTNVGYTTYEILEFVCTTINSGVFNAKQKKEIIEYLKNSFCIVHADYESANVGLWKSSNKPILKKILFGHDNIDHFNMGLVLGKNAAKIIGANPSFKRDIKTLSAFKGVVIPNGNNAAYLKQLNNNFYKFSSFNKKIQNPTKKNTSVSSILISNPDIRVGTQNALELSTFFNGITTLEMNRSYPYLNATFILPSLSSQKNTSTVDRGNSREFKISATSSTINSFLFGETKNKTKNYDALAGEKVDKNVVKTNMSIFTSPQTMVNFDEPIGHSQNNPDSNRRTTVHDPTQPFMSITSFNISASATKGLMSYKSGTLSVVLHDRTRMNEIAPFVKPDLLGSFGAEICIEYGWSNPDENNPKNPIGYFIGNSRVVEKYMIKNSSFSVDNNGQVNIDLSITMKGTDDFKNRQISSRVADRLVESEFVNSIANLNYFRGVLLDETGDLLDEFDLNRSQFKGIFDESRRLSPEQNKALSSFQTPSIRLLRLLNKNYSKYLNITSTQIENKNALKLSFDNSMPKDILEHFCLMLTSESRSQVESQVSQAISSNSRVEFIINNGIKPQDAMDIVKSIFESLEEVVNFITEVSRDDIVEGENEQKILESIVGSLNYIDHFYPTSKKLYPKNPTYYISLGAVINTIVQQYVATPSKSALRFDEIQTVFYSANENAAAMANENISKFLIDKVMLKDFLKDIFSRRVVISPESLITQIINQFIQVKDNVTIGLSDLFEDKGRDWKKKTKPSQSLVNTSTKIDDAIKTKLRSIYGVKSSVNSKDLVFKMPHIHMRFDCLTSGGLESSSKERTILRISIYDKANSPFNASSDILQSIYTGNYQKAFGTFIKNRSDYKNNSREDKKAYELKNLQAFNTAQSNELKKLTKAGWLKYDKKSKSYFINKDKIAGKKNFKGSIKDVYKEIYPSLTFGAQNSVMLSANVSTINDNNLSTIFMTRPERNDPSLINNRVSKELPLIINPTQASVEIFGCPWVSFGQTVFLDFETGTTLDNKYVITGITHSLSQGKFTTQLTLSYGDNFGQYKNIEDILNEKQKIDKKNSKSNLKKPVSREIKNYTIDPNYTKSPFYAPQLGNVLIQIQKGE